MEKCFYIFKFIVAFEPFIGKRFKKKKEMGRLSRLEDENCFIKNRMHRSKIKWPKVFLLMTFSYSNHVKDRWRDLGHVSILIL